MKILLAELWHAKRASGAPWVRKFGKPSIQGKFGYDVAYVRTLFEGEGRESGVSPSGGGVCYRSPMHLCNPPFSWREIAKEMGWLSLRSKTCLLQLLHCIRIL